MTFVKISEYKFRDVTHFRLISSFEILCNLQLATYILSVLQKHWSKMGEVLKLKDGNYRYKTSTLWVLKITEGQCMMYRTACLDLNTETNESMKMEFEYGDFGEAPELLQKEANGQKNYNLLMKGWGGVLNMKGIVKRDQKTILALDFMNPENIEVLSKVNDQDLQELVESGDHYENMSTPYKIQPENKGKFVWITGPPGAGKSTSAQLFSRNNEYAYFEADCVMSFGNPYIPSDVANPSMAQWYQKHLKVGTFM